MKEKFHRLLMKVNRWHSVHAYNAVIERNLRRYRGNRDLAMMASIGAQSVHDFERQGDGHVAVLRHNGLTNGMSVYDLGCGCGRTALALQRSQWNGNYRGVDIARPLIEYLHEKCPTYEAIVHRELNILAPDSSLDFVFHWSVFTHLYPEECYLYMKDSFRSLKPGGKLIFSFLELEDERHHQIFFNRVNHFHKLGWSAELDTFLHRDWVKFWANAIGFKELEFTDGTDNTNHPEFWQSIVSMVR